MSAPVQAWDKATAEVGLRRRKTWRILGYCVGGLLILSIVVDHLLPGNRTFDPWLQFDGYEVDFVAATDAQTIAVAGPGGESALVIIEGIHSGGSEWDRKVAERLNEMLRGKRVILHLNRTDPRDSARDLRADVFVSDELLSGELAGEGLVMADRASKSDFQSTINQKETQAKKHRLGLWADSK